MSRPIRWICRAILCSLPLASSAFAQTTPQPGERPTAVLNAQPWSYGPLVQGGVGLTEERNSFGFLMAGGHLGKVLTGPKGPGPLRGDFEYAVEVFPFWQSYTPVKQRNQCVPVSSPPGSILCSAPYNIGGTFTGASITPTILRWNLNGTRTVSFWVQGAGGVLWTNHKYPGFGGPPVLAGVISNGALAAILQNNGPSADASVWNFTPQGGIGLHWFFKPRRSIDFGANAVHISSASLGDRNPGVNASLQFSLGTTRWK
ncbi:MAG: acyloxyacyl hydrolase [Acidobacteriota bacterium]|nr:acyloxyacyl hydrolase [Acidobacteriota bacterium]